MKAILKTNIIIPQKKPCVRTYLSIVDAGGLSFHVYYSTKNKKNAPDPVELLALS